MIFIYHYPEKGTCDSKKQAWCCAGMEICRNPSANMFFAALISISKVNSTAKMKKEAVPMISHFLPFWQLYSTKRYRSNLINWGLLPLRTDEPLNLPVGTYLLIRIGQKRILCRNTGFAIRICRVCDFMYAGYTYRG